MVVGLGSLVMLGGAQAGAGGQGGQLGQGPPHVGFGEPREPNSTSARLQEQQARARNQDRQKRLEEETAKLYALAGELKDDVAKSNKDTLSLDVIKKADEIERLAHNVKERMKG